MKYTFFLIFTLSQISLFASNPIVNSDNNALVVTLSPSSTVLDCVQNSSILLSPTLSGQSSTVTYQWSGPNVNTLTTSSITISIPGTYAVTVTDVTNNCSGNDSVVITGTTTPPTVDAGPDQVIGCGPVPILTGTSSSAAATYEWVDNNNFVGVILSLIHISSPRDRG